MPPAQRPATAMIFGILNIVFGIMGICGSLISGGMLIAVGSGQLDQQMMDQMQQFNDPVYFGFLSMQLVLGSIFAIVAIISGVGLIQFRPWGRKLANIYSIASLVLLIIGFVFNLVYAVLPAIQAANSGDADPAQVGGAIGGAVGGILGSCFGGIYPICALYFLNRKSFVAAIENQPTL